MSVPEALFQFVFCAGVARVALPMFLVVSGFLMVKDYDGSSAWWRRVLARRLRTVYVPFVCWNVVAWLWSWAHGSPNAVFGVRSVAERILGLNLLVWPACVQFWYFRALLVYALALPVVCPLLRRFRLGLCVVAAVWLAGFLRVPSPCIELAWENTCYFLAGVWLSLHRDWAAAFMARFAQPLRRAVPLAYGWLLLVVIAAGFAPFRPLYSQTFYLLIPVGCATLWMALPVLSRVVAPARGLFKYSIPVFALHLMALGTAEAWFVKGLGVANRLAPWVIVAEAALAVAAAMAVGWAVRRAAPGLFAALVGWRDRR